MVCEAISSRVGAADHRRGEPDELRPQPGIVGCADPEQPEVQHAEHEVAAGEHHRPLQAARASRRTPRGSSARRRTWWPSRRASPCRSRPSSALHDAAEPRVAHPAPPQDGHDEHAAHDLAEARSVLGHDRGDLGQREDEDQIEEQLQRRDRRPLPDRLYAGPPRCRHDNDGAAAQPSRPSDRVVAPRVLRSGGPGPAPGSRCPGPTGAGPTAWSSCRDGPPDLARFSVPNR